ncbi:hypothetical protein [Psittacicella gerlachiana]|uniref:Uncharacterized protein n=1 Tax=Psittacicella gerlachiana TaxID=2028574 RepID=A0A3A1YHS9_9GAMM|nr:hypothetical protein [Psittacicella gerlachiana]RIY37813.1 hypothetical protein CKF59_01465 [Psittacicella gerlachiana]
MRSYFKTLTALVILSTTGSISTALAQTVNQLQVPLEALHQALSLEHFPGDKQNLNVKAYRKEVTSYLATNYRQAFRMYFTSTNRYTYKVTPDYSVLKLLWDFAQTCRQEQSQESTCADAILLQDLYQSKDNLNNFLAFFYFNAGDTLENPFYFRKFMAEYPFAQRDGFDIISRNNDELLAQRMSRSEYVELMGLPANDPVVSINNQLVYNEVKDRVLHNYQINLQPQ